MRAAGRGCVYWGVQPQGAPDRRAQRYGCVCLLGLRTDLGARRSMGFAVKAQIACTHSTECRGRRLGGSHRGLTGALTANGAPRLHAGPPAAPRRRCTTFRVTGPLGAGSRMGGLPLRRPSVCDRGPRTGARFVGSSHHTARGAANTLRTPAAAVDKAPLQRPRFQTRLRRIPARPKTEKKDDRREAVTRSCAVPAVYQCQGGTTAQTRSGWTPCLSGCPPRALGWTVPTAQCRPLLLPQRRPPRGWARPWWEAPHLCFPFGSQRGCRDRFRGPVDASGPRTRSFAAACCLEAYLNALLPRGPGRPRI